MSCTSSSSVTNASLTLTSLNNKINSTGITNQQHDHTEIEISQLRSIGGGASAMGASDPGTSSSFTASNSSTTGHGSTSSGSGSVENMSTIENGDLSVFTFIIPNSQTWNSCSRYSSPPLYSPNSVRHNSLCNLSHHHEPIISEPPSLSPYYKNYNSGIVDGSQGRKYSLPSSSTCMCAKTSYIGNGSSSLYHGTSSATSLYRNGTDSGHSGDHARSFSHDCGQQSRSNDNGAGISNFSLDSLRLDNPPYHKHQTQHTQYCQHYHQLQRHGCDECEPKLSSSPYFSHHMYHQPHQRLPSVLHDRNYMRSFSRSGDDLLLKSLEKGVLFPVVHWSSKYNENFTHHHHHHNQYGPTVAYNQGIYKELKRVIPSDNWLNRERIPRVTAAPAPTSSSSSRRSTWLIIGYKSLEKTLDSTLEATWKDWTGVRHIYINLRHDFEICKISFLHRVHPQDNLDLFMYIVIMEIGNVDEKNTIWLLDFVQRMRVERMKGFITVYAEAEQGISSIDDEYCKYMNQDIGQTKNFGLSLLSSLPSPWSPSFVRHKSSDGMWSRNKTNGVSSSGSASLPSSITSGTSPPPPLSTTKVDSSSAKHDEPSEAVGTLSSKVNTLAETTSSIADHNAEINGNLRVIEKLLEEIHHQQPIGDYF